MKPIIFILTALFILLQYQLWFASGGVFTAYRLHSNITKQAQMNKKLQERNAILVADIKELKHGNDAVEERARNDLGMIKKGEVFYQIVQPKAE